MFWGERAMLLLICARSDVKFFSIGRSRRRRRRVVEYRQLLRQQVIDDVLLLEDPTRPTTEKTGVIAQQQNVLHSDQERRHPLAPALIARALKRAEKLMTGIDGVVCSDYGKGGSAPDFLQPMFAMTRAACRPIIRFDPKGRDFSRYHGATVLTPNLPKLNTPAVSRWMTRKSRRECGRRSSATEPGAGFAGHAW